MKKVSRKSHIKVICKKAVLSRILKASVPKERLGKIYKSLVQPFFEYCTSLWNNCGKLLKDKLKIFNLTLLEF